VAAIDTEALTLRIPREAADLLRRLAGSDGSNGKPVEDLAANLLTRAAEQRERFRRSAERRQAAWDRLIAEGHTEEELYAEIDAAVEEVRAEKSLRQRHDELEGRA
jgi:hypothetical protein